MVGETLINVTREFQTQKTIDEEILARLEALEAAVIWLGDRHAALKTRLSLHCDWEHTAGGLCVTSLPWNSSVHDWNLVKHHLQDAFDVSLRSHVNSLHVQLKNQIQQLQELTTQKAFATLQSDLSWLNPTTWFSGLNLRMWVFIGLASGLLIVLFIILSLLFSCIHSAQKVEAHVMTMLLINGIALYKRGGDVENQQA